MANVELSQNEYQALLDSQAQARQLKKDYDGLNEEFTNKGNAFQEERDKRKASNARIEELEALVWTKDNEFSEYKEKFAEFDNYKTKAEAFDTYNEKQKEKLAWKLDKLVTDLWEDVMEKHNKFIENMSDELKIEYLSDVKGSKKKWDFKWSPNEDGDKKDAPKVDERLVELKKLKDSWNLWPSEKIEYLTLMSKQESKI